MAGDNMAGDNDETAQLSPERMQLVMWEGKALMTIGKAAEADASRPFSDVWSDFVAENPAPEVHDAGFDADAYLEQTRLRAEEAYAEAGGLG